MCQYRMDYYEISTELLQGQLASNPTSVYANNLKACNQYYQYNGKAAEAEIRSLLNDASGSIAIEKNEVIKHNLVVFRNGENAMMVLPPLVDKI